MTYNEDTDEFTGGKTKSMLGVPIFDESDENRPIIAVLVFFNRLIEVKAGKSEKKKKKHLIGSFSKADMKMLSGIQHQASFLYTLALRMQAVADREASIEGEFEDRNMQLQRQWAGRARKLLDACTGVAAHVDLKALCTTIIKKSKLLMSADHVKLYLEEDLFGNWFHKLASSSPKQSENKRMMRVASGQLGISGAQVAPLDIAKSIISEQERKKAAVAAAVAAARMGQSGADSTSTRSTSHGPNGGKSVSISRTSSGRNMESRKRGESGGRADRLLQSEGYDRRRHSVVQYSIDPNNRMRESRSPLLTKSMTASMRSNENSRGDSDGEDGEPTSIKPADHVAVTQMSLNIKNVAKGIVQDGQRGKDRRDVSFFEGKPTKSRGKVNEDFLIGRDGIKARHEVDIDLSEEKEEGLTCVLFVPITDDDGYTQAVIRISREKGDLPFSSDDVLLFESFARTCGNAILSARFLEHTAAVQKSVFHLTAHDDVREMSESVSDNASSMLKAESVFVYLTDESTRSLGHLPVNLGQADDAMLGRIRTDKHTFLSQVVLQCFQSSRILNIPSVRVDKSIHPPEEDSEHYANFYPSGIDSVLAVPVHDLEASTVGVIIALNKIGHGSGGGHSLHVPFSSSDEVGLTLYAAQTGQLLRNAQRLKLTMAESDKAKETVSLLKESVGLLLKPEIEVKDAQQGNAFKSKKKKMVTVTFDEATIHTIAPLINGIVEAKRGRIFVVDREKQALVTYMPRSRELSLSGSDVLERRSMLLTQGYLGECVRMGALINRSVADQTRHEHLKGEERERHAFDPHDVSDLSGFSDHEKDTLEVKDMHSVLCVPLKDTRGDIIGAVEVVNKMEAGPDMPSFSIDDENLLIRVTQFLVRGDGHPLCPFSFLFST
mmetsp:Transcript_851/g.1607  ORF Transcript_851/g.1607 Transcript_851/m.1607 type:complete len:891 (-) Transcript_851:450-3122(-)